MTKSLLETTDKPEYNIRRTWSKLLSEGGEPNANMHVEYLLIRGLITKYPETIEQKAARLKKAFPHTVRFSYTHVLANYRYYNKSSYKFCSDELFAKVKEEAAALVVYLRGY